MGTGEFNAGGNPVDDQHPIQGVVETLLDTLCYVDRDKLRTERFYSVFVGIKDLMAWTDMETFRRVPRFMEEKRDKKAREIRDSWLSKKYFFGPDSPATREGRNLVSSTSDKTAKKMLSFIVLSIVYFLYEMMMRLLQFYID